MVDFYGGLYYLQSMGLTDLLLPFMLIFTVVFAIMTKSKILGEKKNYNVVFALSMALLVVIPHITGTYPPGMDAVQIINSALPSVSVIMIAAICMLLLLGVFGGTGKIKGWLFGVAAFISIFAITYIFGASANLWGPLPNFLSFLNDPQLQAVVILLLVFGLIVGYVVGEDTPDNGFGKSAAKFFDGLGKAAGGE